MDNLDFNGRIFAGTDEELIDLVGNEDQSATPNLLHARILYYNVAMIPLQFRNSPPPLSAQQHDTPDVTTPGFNLQDNRRFGRYCGAWLAFVATYLAMCAFLLAYTQLKFQSETDSPFQTHLGFIIMSIIAIFLTLFTSGIVVYTNNDLQSLMKEDFSPVYEVILKSLFCFSAILTPLSLLLLLFVPHKFNWTGYLLVCALFVVILAFNFHTLKRLLGAKGTNNCTGFKMV